MTVRALVLTGWGINCEREMAHGFRLAGAEATIAHLADVMEGRIPLDGFRILAFPGGFSYGDHLGSGLALAKRIRYSPFWEELLRFIADGNYVWGVCNGFQALVKLGLLPALDGFGTPSVTLTGNDSGRFEDRWVRLRVPAGSRCVYTEGLTSLMLPSRHGEGKLLADPETLLRLEREGCVVLQYTDVTGEATEQYPDNPNGSPRGIAGLCDPSGRIFGLMPHPEAFLDFTQHPHWTRLKRDLKREGRPIPREGEGLALFRNVVQHAARATSPSEQAVERRHGARA